MHALTTLRRALAPLFALLLTALLTADPATAQLAADGVVTRPALALTYGTYFGGPGLSESINAVVTDAEGNVFIVGNTDSTVPVTSGVFQPEPAGISDGFVAKFDEAGGLLWSTYFGGSHSDSAQAVAVGPDGTVYVTGTTLSEDLPTTAGALQRDFKGQNTGCEFVCSGDAFVARFSADGSSLEYSTYLGGSAGESGNALAVSELGEATVAGWTGSTDFPSSQNAFDPAYNQPTCFDQCEADAFIATINPAGTALKRATFLGGTSWDSPADLAVDAAGDVYVAGSTRSTDLPTTEGAFQTDKNGRGDFDFSGFVAKLDAELTTARYVTYLGGRSEEHISGLTLGPEGRAWVTGFGGGGVPTTEDALQRALRGSSDAFATGFSPDGSSLVYSTRFGGSREDYGRSITLDARGRVHLAGSTASGDLPTRRALQSGKSGFDDLFLARFKPGAGRVQKSTFIGGENFEAATDLALTPSGSAYIVGSSESTTLPLAGRFVQSDRGRNDGVLMRVDDGRLVHAKVDDGGFWQPRMRPHLGETVKWHIAETNNRANRLVETSADLFDTKARPPGADYYFTFPAGRFTVGHARGDVVQRIAIAPVAAYGDQPTGGVEVRWGLFPFGQRITFDVQVKVGSGQWETWLDDTTEIGAVYTGGVANYRFRVRVQNVATGTTTPWSPAVLLSEPS